MTVIINVVSLKLFPKFNSFAFISRSCDLSCIFCILRWSEAGSDPGTWCIQAVLLWPHTQQPIPDQRSHTDARNRGTLCLHHWHDMYVVNNRLLHLPCVFLDASCEISSAMLMFCCVYVCVGGRGGGCLCGLQINFMTTCQCNCDRWHCLVLLLPVPAPTQAPTKPPTTEPPPTIPPPKEGEQEV